MRIRLRLVANTQRSERPGIKWHDYDRFMSKYVKKIRAERRTKVPTPTKPYRDEHDDDVLGRREAGIG
jgi:hypothetical protein